MNKLLHRQLQKYYGVTAPIPENLIKLLNVISDSYDHYDKDRKMIERSIELSSMEMVELNNELRKEKEQLAKSNLRYQYVTKATSDAIWDWDIASNIVFWGDGYTQLFGLINDEGELNDIEKVHKRIHPEDINAVLSSASAALKSKGLNWNCEHRYLRSDGSYAVVSNKAVIVRDDKGHVVRVIGAMQDITERKKNEAHIKYSEHRYRTLFEQNIAGFYQSTPEGKIISCNIAFAKMLRYDSPEELMELDANQLYFSSADRNVFINSINRQKKLVNYEGVLKCKDGSALYFLENTSEQTDPVTGTIFLDGILIDISDRKLAEQNILNSEEKRRLIMNAALDAIICIDIEGNINFWNPQAEKIFGWNEKEVMGKRLSGIIIPEQYRKMHDEGIVNYLKTGNAPALNILLELSAINRGGSIFPIELTVLPIRQGSEEFFCAFIRDITERKKAENAILISNERYNLVAKATSDIIWDWDLSSNTVIRSVENMKKIFGYDVEAINENAYFWTSLIHPEDLPKINELLQRTFDNSSEIYMDSEYRIRKANGQYAYIYDKGFIVRDINGKAIRMIGSCQDISKIKEHEFQLQKQAKELAISNAELEQFAYVTSHDLQEPLRMVSSFLTLLEKKYGNLIDDKGKQYIGFAVDGARRMRRIILDLLEFSRVGTMEEKLESVDINEVVEEIKILFRKTIKDQNTSFIIPRLPVIQGYKSPLHMVFQNLIGNALKYTRVDIESHVQIVVKELEMYWQFTVIDNGIGINKEYFDRIFIIFQRLHNNAEYLGTGMGLAVTKKIIENLGGRIWVESEEGQGSSFYFTVPKIT